MNCGIEYPKRTNISLQRWLATSKFCSRQCMQSINPGAISVKGKPSWNAGTKGLTKANSGSFKKGQRISPNTEFKKGQTSNDKNINWKGDNAGYTAIHGWVKRRKPLKGICEWCKNNRYTEMANLDYKYSRNLNTWAELCAPCHKKYDRQNNWGFATREFKLHV